MEQPLLDADNDREIFKHNNQIKDKMMLETAREIIKGMETRKTLSHQAKLSQQGIDKDKIQIEELGGQGDKK